MITEETRSRLVVNVRVLEGTRSEVWNVLTSEGFRLAAVREAALREAVRDLTSAINRIRAVLG